MFTCFNDLFITGAQKMKQWLDAFLLLIAYTISSLEGFTLWEMCYC